MDMPNNMIPISEDPHGGASGRIWAPALSDPPLFLSYQWIIA